MQGFIVWWIKKDIRTADNRALFEAIQYSREMQIPLLAVWLTEPAHLSAKEFHSRRERFVFDCLAELESRLRQFKVPLVIIEGHALDAFSFLAKNGMVRLYSHEETGVLWTYKRDREVKSFCKAHSISWSEYPTNGVVRGLKRREHWQSQYQGLVHRPPLSEPVQVAFDGMSVLNSLHINRPSSLNVFTWNHVSESKINSAARSCVLVQQRGGESVAHKLLDRFLQPRIHTSYVRCLSRPHDAQYFSSRLSPYLAFGCISSRQIISRLNSARLESGTSTRALNAFQSRLAWRCHFTQKLENFSEMEDVEQNDALRNLRPPMSSEEFERWHTGQTGVPLVDACLRSVHQTGFLNFRMRAMLMSFATHLMWKDWREPAWDLARAFLDFEPGIHFSQVQMQAAVTGNNQIRIYNPIKQAMEQDPSAKFIRQWVPELRSVETDDILAMHDLPQSYPQPIVSIEAAMRSAREQLFRKFKDPEVRAEAKVVQEKLGSRGGPLSWRGRKQLKHRKDGASDDRKLPTLFEDVE